MKLYIILITIILLIGSVNALTIEAGVTFDPDNVNTNYSFMNNTEMDSLSINSSWIEINNTILKIIPDTGNLNVSIYNFSTNLNKYKSYNITNTSMVNSATITMNTYAVNKNVTYYKNGALQPTLIANLSGYVNFSHTGFSSYNITTYTNDLVINDCTELTEDGYTYNLESDITNYAIASTCFTISADNVILDCNNHIVDGIDIGGQSGVVITRTPQYKTNITVKNCYFTDWIYSIINQRADNNVFDNITSISSVISIRVDNGDNLTFEDIYSADENNILYMENITNSTINNVTTSGDGTKFSFRENSYNVNLTNSSIQGDYIFSFAKVSGVQPNNIYIYNNFINYTVDDVSSSGGFVATSIYLNTTKQTGNREYSDGVEIGGNYWANSAGTGYSETCADHNSDMFCDLPYTPLSGMTDYLPLSDEDSITLIIVEPTNTTHTTTTLNTKWNSRLNLSFIEYSINDTANVSLYTWNSNSTFISNLNPGDNIRQPNLFYLDDLLHVIGADGLNLEALTWNNTNKVWLSNASLVNINTPFSQVLGIESPSTYYNDNTLFAITGEDDSDTYYGLRWNGTSWETNTSIISGLPTSGINNPTPEVFNKDGTLYLITGMANGTFRGFNWTGSTWQLDVAITDGLTDIGANSDPSIFHSGNNLFLLSGTNNVNIKAFIYLVNRWYEYNKFTDEITGIGTITSVGAINITDTSGLVDETYIFISNNSGLVDTYKHNLINDTFNSVDGYNNLTLYGITYDSNYTYRSVLFEVDLLPPFIDIISPLNMTYSTVYNWFNVSVTDTISDIDWCGYSLNGIDNVTMTELNNSYFYKQNTSMYEKYHNVIFSCNDTFGRINRTQTLLFTHSYDYPTWTNITYIDLVINNTNQTITINATDINSSISVVYFEYNGINYTGIQSGDIWTGTYNQSTIGNITANIWVHDEADNINTTSISYHGADINFTYSNSSEPWIEPNATGYSGLYPMRYQPPLTIYYNDGNGSDIRVNVTINQSVNSCLDFYLYNQSLILDEVEATAHHFNAPTDIKTLSFMSNNTNLSVYGWTKFTRCTSGQSYFYDYWFDFYNS